MSRNIEISEFKFNIGCQVYGCKGRTAYRIGKHGLTTPDDLHICKDCLDELIEQIIPMIPKEKLPTVEVEKVVEQKETEQKPKETKKKVTEVSYKGGIK